MRKISSTFFVLLYVFASTELHQLMRLPILIDHFVEHRLDTPTISFSDYIALHYSGDNQTETEIGRDSQLPFKNANCPEVFITIGMPPEEFPEATTQVFGLAPDVIVPHSSTITSAVQVSIWQPPRV